MHILLSDPTLCRHMITVVDRAPFGFLSNPNRKMKTLYTHTMCLNNGARSIRPQQVELSQESAEFGSKINIKWNFKHYAD